MEKAVTITPEELLEFWDNSEWVLKVIPDLRKAKGMRCMIVGLQFAYSAFARAGCGQRTLSLVKRCLDDGIKAYLETPRYINLFNDSKNETDKVIDWMFQMATFDDVSGGMLLKEGLHYVAELTRVHLKINSIFIKFYKLAKEQGWLIEYSSASGFIQSLSDREYYLGTGMVSGVPTPSQWHTLSIPHLVEHGIDVSRLERK
jgi:hypothetical protein